MANFKLFLCRLGNGITVCNKAVVEHGDYKTIAHIAECGKITWYINQNTIPNEDLKKIEQTATEQNMEWERWLNRMPETKQYEILLNKVPVEHMLYAFNLAEIKERVNYLKTICYENSCF